MTPTQPTDAATLLALAEGRPMIAICSARPRPSTQNNHARFGSQWWARDVYHLAADNKRTLCGRDASEYLTIGPVETLDHNCCARCALRARATLSGDDHGKA